MVSVCGAPHFFERDLFLLLGQFGPARVKSFYGVLCIFHLLAGFEQSLAIAGHFGIRKRVLLGSQELFGLRDGFFHVGKFPLLLVGEFAPGFKTSSDWLVQHERYVAFSARFVKGRGKYTQSVKLMESMLDKSLQYREAKPGGNPQFMIDGCEILAKAWSIISYTYVWGFFNIPAKICPQKNIYEWQVKNYEKLAADLEDALKKPVDTIDHLKTKHLYTLIENSLIKKIEEAEDLLSLFSETAMGAVVPTSVLARWTCASCSYSNHPVEQEKQCGHCSKPRPEVKILWFDAE